MRIDLLIRSFALLFSVFALAMGWIPQASAEDSRLSQLYAARPPAGSSYVRVVNAVPQRALQVKVANGPTQPLGGETIASTYAIVGGDQPFALQVNGAVAATVKVRPDTFTTFVLRKSQAGYAFVAIDDTSDTEDALKAELRFYNLVIDCPSASLRLASKNAVVFKAVAPDAATARSVNPVSATLAGGCAAESTVPVALPEMNPGDHLGLFLTGTASAPVLTVQPSRTDAFKR